MNEAYFIWNPYSITELKVNKKAGGVFNYIIERIEEISYQEYKKFSHHMLLEYDFILRNADIMHLDSSHVQHCILVTVSGAIDGILIQNAGSDRYAAFWSYLSNIQTHNKGKEK